MKNLGLIFNKVCYQKLGKDTVVDSKDKRTVYQIDLDKHMDEIRTATFDAKRDYKKSEVANKIFRLQTSYPGLLIGTGNPHGACSYAGDIVTGFSFDYVTGQPYIPGSSVKGILRSHFREHPQVITEVAQSVGIEKPIDVKALEKEIFDGNDVFLDAVICKGQEGSGLVVGDDYITPHASPVKNPVPIHILKVLPGVKIEFRFRLTEGEPENNGLTAKEKADLFRELILLFGVGAKTNVGYGAMEPSVGNGQK